MPSVPAVVKAVLLVGASFAFTLGGVCMKYSEGLTKNGPSILLFVLFSAGAAFQALAMKNSEMAITYIVVLGLESVLAFLLGVLVFHEGASADRIFAVCLVTAGIVLLNR
jgi:multidrug transporter EmrE-like cation transporter